MRKRTHTPSAGYSADTEILTRQGWVTFDRLTYLDEVATRSEAGDFEWQPPESITWQPHDGEMVSLHGRATDLLVVPAHRVLWCPDARDGKSISPAADILSRAARLSRPRAAGCTIARSAWDAPEMAGFTFRGVRHSKMGPRPRDVRMTGDQYAAFMGMYTAEGCAIRARYDSKICIAQTVAGKGFTEYRDLLIQIFGREPGKSGSHRDVWVISARALYDYLAPLGKAVSKYLPADVMGLSRRQLQIFWDYYFLGDGSYEAREGRTSAPVAATASRTLADQLQEVVQKLGASAAVCVNKTRPTSLVRAGGIIYKVRMRGTERPAFRAASIPYSGYVGCVRVRNEAVYVRRSGKPAWCC